MRHALLLALAGAGCSPDALVGPSDHAPLGFRFPVLQPERIGTTVGVDHDPVEHEGTLGGALCTNYAGEGFPHCYDGHRGSDFMLAGGFPAMDAGSADVVAAADGVVVFVEDVHYDRCHVDIDDIDCDGFEQIANKVIVRHAFGVHTSYVHLMTASATVEVGDHVRCGDLLGVIGSSGTSSAPHLHFQVEDADGWVIDPFAGTESQPFSWWAAQQPLGDLPLGTCAR